MSHTLTKKLDGDISLGNLRAEEVTLTSTLSDYPTGGYLIEGIGGTTETTGTVGLDKVLFVIPIGGEGGYKPTFNPTTSKVEIYQQSGATGALTELPAGTDISAYSFNLLVVGI